MNRKRLRFAPAFTVVIESLESRVVPSGMSSAGGLTGVAARGLRSAPTALKLTITAGTLGQPINFDATVRGAAAAGAPTGTVNVMDHGAVIATLELAPTASTTPRFAVSEGTATLMALPGGSGYFFGKHPVTAVFVPSGPFARSRASQVFTVSQPTYTTLAGGVKTATITEGSGPAIQSGQTASVLYTGYLAKTGQVFDDSIKDGGSPLSFRLGSGQVIPGFDAGTTGMKVGETRIVLIPPAEGYGAVANGPIPANSTLIFELTLKSIS